MASGVVARYGGIVVGNTVGISPSLTLGLSAKTGNVNVEALRKLLDGANAVIRGLRWKT